MSQLRPLKLPDDLCLEAERRFGHKLGNIEQILEYVLRELLRDKADTMDAAEQQMIEQRLRDLGYL